MNIQEDITDAQEALTLALKDLEDSFTWYLNRKRQVEELQAQLKK